VAIERLVTLTHLCSELESVQSSSADTQRTTAQAILDVARQRDADLVIVGIRRGHGSTVLSLMEHAERSVLALPLAPTDT
jgi:hypothetical protein